MSNKQELQQLRTVYRAKLRCNIETIINTGEVDDIFDKLEELASNIREAYRDNIGDLNQIEDWVDAIQTRLMCVSHVLPYYSLPDVIFDEHTNPGDANAVRSQPLEKDIEPNPTPVDTTVVDVDASIPYYLRNLDGRYKKTPIVSGRGNALAIGLRNRGVVALRYSPKRVLSALGSFDPSLVIVTYNERYNRLTTTLGELKSHGDIVSFELDTLKLIGYRPKNGSGEDKWIRAIYLNSDGYLALSNRPLSNSDTYTLIQPDESIKYPQLELDDTGRYISKRPYDIKAKIEMDKPAICPLATVYADEGETLEIGYKGTNVRYSNYRADYVYRTLGRCGNQLDRHPLGSPRRNTVDAFVRYTPVIYFHGDVYLIGILVDGHFHPFYINTLSRVALSRNAYYHVDGVVRPLERKVTIHLIRR